jgi:hypothetical protein
MAVVMAIVHLAHDLMPQPPVGIKVLDPERQSGAAEAERRMSRLN